MGLELVLAGEHPAAAGGDGQRPVTFGRFRLPLELDERLLGVFRAPCTEIGLDEVWSGPGDGRLAEAPRDTEALDELELLDSLVGAAEPEVEQAEGGLSEVAHRLGSGHLDELERPPRVRAAFLLPSLGGFHVRKPDEAVCELVRLAG